ncbi:hypothetical protein [Tenacibaculum sp. 190524A05c]|uniref:hypothetical protein n=1 Tax=Tenacibaculum platacis TaxID=3137852 RepID=UPI0032B11854
MIKYIKYVLSLLLVFGQAEGEYSIFSQLQTTSYHQILVSRRRCSTNQISYYKQKEVVKPNLKVEFLKDFSFISIHLHGLCRVVIKIHKKSFQRLKSTFINQFFLTSRIAASNFA